jgi:hypothetical protein
VKTYSSYKVEDAGGIGAFTAVVHGTNVGQCKLPTAQNAAGFAGFTADSGVQGDTIPVVRGTRCRATAAGVITHGHWVRINGVTGKVEDCQTAVDAAPGVAADTYVIGKAETDAAVDGDPVYVTTQEFVAKVAAS